MLSRETQKEDRTVKLAECSAVPSIAHYVLVEQSEYPVHVYGRVGTGDFIIKPQEIRGLDGGFELPAIGISMSVAKIYEGLDFSVEIDADAPQPTQSPWRSRTRHKPINSMPRSTKPHHYVNLLLQTAVAATNLKNSESRKEQSVAYGMATAR